MASSFRRLKVVFDLVYNIRYVRFTNTTTNCMYGGDMSVYVPTNDRGIPIGQYHHRATVSDETVYQIRDLREERGLTYGQLAMKFKLPYHYIKKVCRYERRVQVAHGWKKRVERRFYCGLR